MQAYETLIIVVSKALGGSSGDHPQSDAPVPKTAAELEAALAKVFG
jgi:hypothetical protein